MKLINKIAFVTMMFSFLCICLFGMALDSLSDTPMRAVLIFTALFGVSLYIYYDSERRM